MFLRNCSTESFPDQTVWKLLKYPGYFTLPIYLLALPDPFPPELSSPLDQLHHEMRSDGVPHGYMETSYHRDHRQVHLWIAKIGIGTFLPVGQSLFLAEKRRADNLLGGGFVSKWWLLYTWMKASHRDQKIFSTSLDYFRSWHPHFTLRDSTPELRSALKRHPEHLRDESKQVHWV